MRAKFGSVRTGVDTSSRPLAGANPVAAAAVRSLRSTRPRTPAGRGRPHPSSCPLADRRGAAERSVSACAAASGPGGSSAARRCAARCGTPRCVGCSRPDCRPVRRRRVAGLAGRRGAVQPRARGAGGRGRRRLRRRAAALLAWSGRSPVSCSTGGGASGCWSWRTSCARCACSAWPRRRPPAGTGAAFYASALAVVSINRFVLSALSAALPHVVEPDTLVGVNALSTTAGALATALGGGRRDRAADCRSAARRAADALVAAAAALPTCSPVSVADGVRPARARPGRRRARRPGDRRRRGARACATAPGGWRPPRTRRGRWRRSASRATATASDGVHAAALPQLLRRVRAVRGGAAGTRPGRRGDRGGLGAGRAGHPGGDPALRLHRAGRRCCSSWPPPSRSGWGCRSSWR